MTQNNLEHITTTHKNTIISDFFGNNGILKTTFKEVNDTL